MPMFLSLSAPNASCTRFLASRYLTIASAVSSEDAETSRSISTALGLAAEYALPATVKPSMFSAGGTSASGGNNWASRRAQRAQATTTAKHNGRDRWLIHS